jgi:hypothetical protein
VGASGLGAVITAYLLSLLAQVVGIAGCADALLRAQRAGQGAWVAALVALVALPLVARLFAVGARVVAREFTRGSGPLVLPGEQLAFQVAPVSLVVLLAYGVWMARGTRRARRGARAR